MTKGRTETIMSRDEWHVAQEELRRYAAGRCTPPWLWSTEAHLAACDLCRERLTEVAGPELIGVGWSRLDAALDAPIPGRVERLLARLGVADHTARLLTATPALRLSWLAAIASALAFSAVAAVLSDRLSSPIVFLALAPLLPLAGIAASFGPRVDPTYEIALVAPLDTFRLLLLRCAAVLTTTSALSAAVALALPRYGLAALGWFLPSLTLTLLSLALTPRLGPVTATTTVAAGWVVVLAATVRPDTGASIVFGFGGQLTSVAASALAAAAVLRLRPRFENAQHFPTIGHRTHRRNP